MRRNSISQGKMPPNAVDLERLVIGAFLIDKKALDNTYDLLTSEVFYDPRHQEIYRIIIKLFMTHRIDILTVIQELKKQEKLNLAMGTLIS